MQIEQIDRDAAAGIYMGFAERFRFCKGWETLADSIREGIVDDNFVVVTLARHRLAERERCAAIADETVRLWKGEQGCEACGEEIAAAIRGNVNAD